jgi:hypothetical protein
LENEWMQQYHQDNEGQEGDEPMRMHLFYGGQSQQSDAASQSEATV